MPECFLHFLVHRGLLALQCGKLCEQRLLLPAFGLIRLAPKPAHAVDQHGFLLPLDVGLPEQPGRGTGGIRCGTAHAFPFVRAGIGAFALIDVGLQLLQRSGEGRPVLGCMCPGDAGVQGTHAFGTLPASGGRLLQGLARLVGRVGPCRGFQGELLRLGGLAHQHHLAGLIGSGIRLFHQGGGKPRLFLGHIQVLQGQIHGRGRLLALLLALGRGKGGFRARHGEHLVHGRGTVKPGGLQRILFGRGLVLRQRLGLGLGGIHVQACTPADLIEGQGHDVPVQRRIEMVDHLHLHAPAFHKRDLLLEGLGFCCGGNVQGGQVRAFPWPPLHEHLVAPSAGQRQHVLPVGVGGHVGNALAGQFILHDDVGLLVGGVECGCEGALEDGDIDGRLRGADAIHIEGALLAVAVAGEARLLAVRPHDIQQFIGRRVHGKIQVHGRAEDVHARIVGALEHVVPAHTVVALAAEIEAAAIGRHHGEVLILVGIDVAGQLHRRGIATGGQHLGSVDVLAGLAVLAVAAEVDGAALVREEDQGRLLALAVECGQQLVGCHHDLATDAAHVVEPEEIRGCDLGLLEHADVLEAAQQELPVPALLLQDVHGIFRQQFLVGRSLEVLVCGQGLVKLVIELVSLAEEIAGEFRGVRPADRELQVADGLGLGVAAIEGAGAELVVELMVLRGQAHQLGVHRIGLGILAGLEELVRRGLEGLVPTLAVAMARCGPCACQEHYGAYGEPCLHALVLDRPRRSIRASLPFKRRPMFWRWV